jgi:hypothetical protein
MADRLRVTELDFDTIKTNLRTFLNQQSEFTDYDFEGSGLSILLDVLAYNTHYNGYYLNMVANESFMDTALLRDSVVSHAKSLGYVPYSTRAPIATINFLVTAATSTSATLTIPSGYSFLSNQIDSKVYNFVVLEDTTVTKANSSYYFENLDIYEGQLITYSFTHNQATNPKQTFTLPDNNIDTTTIKVTVSPSSVSTAVTVYNLVTDILDVNSTSEVYYLQEAKNGQYQIYFGNNIVGETIPDGGIVSVRYLLTDGTSANKANNFVGALTLTDSLNETLTNFTVTPVSAASGGAERESVDDIKFGAAAQFTTQNRLITTKDYESYLKRNYPSIDSISVWGGEEETPPVYGKVFVSLKPKENYYISETEKQRIIDEIIKPKSIVSVDTIIRDPEYLYLLIENYVEYNKNKTTQTIESLKTSIRNAIILYRDTNLNKFGSTFVLSKLQDSVDGVDLNAINGSETKLYLQKRFEPTLGASTTYTINFNAPLNRGTTTNKLTSSEFRIFDSTGAIKTVLFEEVPESFTGISEIQVTNAGTGYTETPTVTITGDGTGAVANAVVVNGKIQSIVLTNRGINYTRAIVTITGGSGYGAAGSAVLDGKFGYLRTIYYDDNAEKQTINEQIGTINYVTGTITINDVRILSVVPIDGLIRLTIEAGKGIVKTTKNTIISIDDTDTTSITTELSAI